ncbi:MAG TPA: permease [Opitutales bacterium]|nr:permease [Opitutales bacterium]
MNDFWATYAEAAKTALGFFWKAGWAFVLGYAVSAMIQVFVPKKRLTEKMGRPDFKSISLSTVFGTISSSCSFAALSAARSLVQKGAHFICAVAFMFASTNLVIELGILIFIFLGWQFLAAEIIGGLLLIGISSLLIRMIYPQKWLEAARKKVEAEGESEEEDFDWKKRIRSWKGWCMVGQKFCMEWKMVWKEILFGFTVAGFVAVFVPDAFWQTLFLADAAAQNPGNFLIALQNAAVAPFVAAATFIGSMGNIPLATVLNSGGVMFAGIMGFIYSDLMVPPLVKVNAKYYGWRVALYIAGIMYVSIVITALVLHYTFLFTGLTPESARKIEEVAHFAVDYTFFFNLAAIVCTGVMLYLRSVHKKHHSGHEGHHHHDHGSGKIDIQSVLSYACIVILAGGLVAMILG